VDGPEPFRGTGLRLVPVPHAGNNSEAPEEVERIRELMADLLRPGSTWTDADGKTRPLGLDDVLVVTPYNDQVEALRLALPTDARVGTVDKLQGQEAPIVDLLASVVVGGRRPARDGVPGQPESAERGDVTGAVSGGRGGESGAVRG